MKEKILALLAAKFAGVRKDGLARLASALSLQVTDETEAGALVEKYTLEKVNDFIKDYRKDVDTEVSDANKTYEGNLKKKYDFVEKKDSEPGKDPKPSDPNDIATIVANAVKAAVEPLQNKIATIEGSKTTETRLQQLEGKFATLPKGNVVADQFKAQRLKDFKRMNFESEDAFNEYLTEIGTDVDAFSQGLTNQGLAGQSKPHFGNPNASEEEEFAASMAEINKTESN